MLGLGDGRDYRVDAVALPDGLGGTSRQVVFEDVTEERSESRRATRYAAIVVQAEEDQRRRLARELHDEPLQLFLHLGRRLESLAATPGTPASLAGGLMNARRQALEAASRLRSITSELRPPALDHLGLVPALSGLVAGVEEEAGLAAELELEGAKVPLAHQAELGVFRIVEEAVRNAAHHAEASQLRVVLRFGADTLYLKVSDDGTGFEPQELEGLAAEGRLGLLGMAERAHLLGGHLALRSAAGEGTTVEATIPLAASLSDASGFAGGDRSAEPVECAIQPP